MNQLQIAARYLVPLPRNLNEKPLEQRRRVEEWLYVGFKQAYNDYNNGVKKFKRKIQGIEIEVDYEELLRTAWKLLPSMSREALRDQGIFFGPEVVYTSKKIQWGGTYSPKRTLKVPRKKRSNAK